jgi:hypothetical protein
MQVAKYLLIVEVQEKFSRRQKFFTTRQARNLLVGSIRLKSVHEGREQDKIANIVGI